MLHAQPLTIPGLLLLRPATVMDERGWVSLVFDEASMGSVGIHDRFVRDTIIYADKIGTVRGLRYQLAPQKQAEMLRVLRGDIFVAAVDVRRSSPSFGRTVTTRLSYMGGEQLYAMPGFALGWCSLEPATEVLVKTSAPDVPELERGINWRDPALKIEWPVRGADAIISLADIDQPMLAEQRDLMD